MAEEGVTMQLTANYSRELATVRQFSKKYPAFTEGALRWKIFNANQNGLKSALVQIGRRIYINEPEFFRWVHENQNLK